MNRELREQWGDDEEEVYWKHGIANQFKIR